MQASANLYSQVCESQACSGAMPAACMLFLCSLSFAELYLRLVHAKTSTLPLMQYLLFAEHSIAAASLQRHLFLRDLPFVALIFEVLANGNMGSAALRNPKQRQSGNMANTSASAFSSNSKASARNHFSGGTTFGI